MSRFFDTILGWFFQTLDMLNDKVIFNLDGHNVSIITFLITVFIISIIISVFWKGAQK